MAITQTIMASINGQGSNGGGGTPPFNPTDTGWSLGTSWTVEIIAELTPTQFWASLWGNENYFAGTGHFAYFNGLSSLNVGSPNGTDTYTLTDDIATRAYWAFSHTDGGGIAVYRNAVLLTPSSTGYVQPSSPAGNSLLIGARHGNDGTGATDPCPGTYFYYDRSSFGLDATYVQTQYNTLRTTYSIP